MKRALGCDELGFPYRAFYVIVCICKGYPFHWKSLMQISAPPKWKTLVTFANMLHFWCI